MAEGKMIPENPTSFGMRQKRLQALISLGVPYGTELPTENEGTSRASIFIRIDENDATKDKIYTYDDVEDEWNPQASGPGGSSVLLKVNGINNSVQSVFDLIDSDIIKWKYVHPGKIKAVSAENSSSPEVYGEFPNNAAAIEGGVPIGKLYRLPKIEDYYQIGIATLDSVAPEIFDFDALMNLINLQSDDSEKIILSGGKVSEWQDANGLALWSQADSGRRPASNNGVVFDGSDDTLLRSTELAVADYSFYCVVRYLGLNDGTVNGKPLVGARADYDWISFNTNYELKINSNGGEASRRALVGYKGLRHVVIGIRKSGSSFTYTLNDRTCTEIGYQDIPLTYFSRLASINLGVFYSNISVKAMMVSSSVLSDSDHKKVVDELYRRYDLASDNAADNICGFGDSNTFGQGAPSYLNGLSTAMGLANLNLGFIGSSFTNVNSDPNSGFTRFQKDLVTRPYTDYIVIQYGTNDIFAGNVSEEVYGTQLNSMVGSLISQGYSPSKICLCSVPYLKDNESAGKLDAYRTKILGVSATHETKYFDLLQATRDGGGNSLLVDNAHLNEAGQLIWKEGVLNAFTI